MDKKTLTNIKLIGGIAGLFYIAKNFFVNKNTSARLVNTENQNNTKKNNYYNIQTFSNDTYKQYADSIYSYLQYGPSNTTKVINILNSMLNNIDVEKLISAYGNRQTFFYGINLGAKSLLEQLAYSLEKEKENVNLNWSKKFIKYRI